MSKHKKRNKKKTDWWAEALLVVGGGTGSGYTTCGREEERTRVHDLQSH